MNEGLLCIFCDSSSNEFLQSMQINLWLACTYTASKRLVFTVKMNLLIDYVQYIRSSSVHACLTMRDGEVTLYSSGRFNSSLPNYYG